MRPGLGVFGPVDIVVVNVDSGRHRTLVADIGLRGAGGGAAWRQATPYLTSDNRHVIYNADRDGVLNVYAARLPDGFLAGID
jgi:hypothetical protein